MTRQEEYYEEASKYAKTHHSKVDNDFQTAMNIAVQKAFVAAAEWKDSQPQIIEIFGKRLKVVSDVDGGGCRLCSFSSACITIRGSFKGSMMCKNAGGYINRHFVEVDENGINTPEGYYKYDVYRQFEQPLIDEGWEVIVFIPSLEEDEDRITCGNALLSVVS